MPAHRALIASVLKNLGHPVPTDEQLSDAMRSAFLEIKTAKGIDPDKVKYKLSLVPIDRDWVDKTF
ncbi:hypothetical protein PQR33_14865 [Paraburkholderia sediminicola]|uniref:hypothetical protein n=1 Tax=Paraburkholderia sediminicola TaxID=458836 RepID=UPI0038BD714C